MSTVGVGRGCDNLENTEGTHASAIAANATASITRGSASRIHPPLSARSELVKGGSPIAQRAWKLRKNAGVSSSLWTTGASCGRGTSGMTTSSNATLLQGAEKAASVSA